MRVATGSEWGTNDVKVYGKRPGTTTISFVDENTRTIYRVKVTVKGKGNNPQGGEGAAQAGKIDPCLVGERETSAVSGAVTAEAVFV